MEIENTDLPLFEAVTEMNQDLYFEAVKARGNRLKNRIFTVLGAVIAVIGVFMGRNLVVIVCGILIALLASLSHVIIGKRDFNRLLELHPEGTWTKTVRFFNDRIETDSGNPQPTVARYSEITRDFETEHMYIIEFGRGIPATTFSKNGFTKGTLEELVPFLLTKQKEKYDSDSRKKSES